MKNILILTLLSLTVSSCASKPKLYPNSTYKELGKERANAAIDKCTAEAKEYLDSSEGKKLLKSTGAGAAVGGAMGAVAGLFYGNVAQGAARGAAIGGAGGAVSGALSPDELKQRYVNKCLADQGYQVLGWD